MQPGNRLKYAYSIAPDFVCEMPKHYLCAIPKCSYYLYWC